jgi:hypothetical protein
MRKSYLLFSIIMFLGCNSNKDQAIIASDAITQEKNESPKSYDIKRFLVFNNESTYGDAISYFKSNNVNYEENVDLLSFHYYKKNEFPYSTLRVSSCKSAKFLWVKELHIGDLTFENVLFCFDGNNICFITLFKHSLNKGPNKEFETLREYYRRKYGDGETWFSADTSAFSTKIFSEKSYRYKNHRDSVTVFISCLNTEENLTSAINLYDTDEISIYFKNYDALAKKCLALDLENKRKKLYEQYYKEQKIMENL